MKVLGLELEIRPLLVHLCIFGKKKCCVFVLRFLLLKNNSAIDWPLENERFDFGELLNSKMANA